MHKHNLSSLRGWLFALFVGTTLGFILVGGLSLLSNYHGTRSLTNLYRNQLLPEHRINTLKEGYGALVQNILLRLDAGELTTDEAVIQLHSIKDTLTANWQAYRSIEHDSAALFWIKKLDTLLIYSDLEIESTLRYLEIQQSLGNRLLANQVYPIVGSLAPSVRPVQMVLDTLSDIQLRRAENAYLHERTRSASYLFVTMIVVGAIMLIGLLTGMRTLRSIDRQLGATLPALAKLAQGDLSVRIARDSSHDELSLIGDGINRMAQSLQEMVGQMGADAATLAQTSLELTTFAQHTYADSKTHVEQTRQTAAVAQEIALRLESGLDLLANPIPSAESSKRLRATLLALRNENMVAVVQGLANTRATALQSVRGMDLLQHKARVLASISEQLTLRIRRFQGN